MLGAGRDGGQAEARQVAEDGAAHERDQHDGPVREGLAREVGEDHLGGHAAEDEGHGQAEEHEVVLTHEGRVGRVQPGADGERVDGHGDPLEEDGEDGESVAAAGLHHVEHAEGHVAEDERADDDEDPDVADRVVADELVVAEEVPLADEIDDALGPDAGAVDARDGHDAAGDQYALGRAVEVAEVEGVGVVRLPGGEEHGEAGAESGEDAGFGGAQGHGGGLEQAGQGTVQRVDAVVEQLAQSARGAGSSRLLAVDVIHGLVHEETKGEAQIQPRRALMCFETQRLARRPRSGEGVEAGQVGGKEGGCHTGPTRSGMTMTSRATFAKMKQNPRRVTMFGASHSGKSSTKAFHYQRCSVARSSQSAPRAVRYGHSTVTVHT